MPEMNANLPLMNSAGMTLVMGGLVAFSFAAVAPEFLEIAMVGAGAILMISFIMLASWYMGRHPSVDAVRFPDHRLNAMLPAAALLLYVGALAIVGGEVAWSVRQVGLVGLFVFCAANLVVGLYHAFRST
jgi:hypothetical protein